MPIVVGNRAGAAVEIECGIAPAAVAFFTGSVKPVTFDAHVLAGELIVSRRQTSAPSLVRISIIATPILVIVGPVVSPVMRPSITLVVGVTAGQPAVDVQNLTAAASGIDRAGTPAAVALLTPR
jgi:hypothetical protein